MTANIGQAELELIADFEVDDEHFDLAVKLSGRPIERDQVRTMPSGLRCVWPIQLEVPSYTSIRGVGSHLWHLAGYLHKNRDTVRAIRSLGCNLQLNIHDVTLSEELSISAAALKQLGDLDIQLTLRP